MEIFSASKMDSNVLQYEKTWGCPVYVLDPKLQDGKKLPKWDPRTRQGQYLGRSPKHASSVGLIRNLNTGFISPQVHVIYDTRFQTVSGGYEENDAVANHIWNSLAYKESENVLVEANREQEPLPDLHTDWLTPVEQTQRTERELNNEVMRKISTHRI